jgi:hypothetical protein
MAQCNPGDIPLKASNSYAFLEGYIEDMTTEFVKRRVAFLFNMKPLCVHGLYVMEFDDHGNPTNAKNVKTFN